MEMLPMRDGRTNERTREDSATQPMDAGWLSFAIIALVMVSNTVIIVSIAITIVIIFYLGMASDTVIIAIIDHRV